MDNSLRRPPILPRHQNGSLLAELPPVLFFLMFLVLLPILDLLSVGTGMATVVLSTNQAASRAASQPTYSSALSAMADEGMRNVNSVFGQFAKLQPVSGFASSGDNLFVVATNFRQGGSTTFGPNTAVPPPVDTASNIYEYSVTSTYNAGPLVNLHFLPYIGDVPGIGKPMCLTFTATRAVEHTDGLDDGAVASSGSSGGGGGGGGGAVSKFNRTLVNSYGGAQSGQDSSGWYWPYIYKNIEAAGQTVVMSTVIIVPATSTWVPSSVNAQPNQTLWIDTKALGLWDAGGTFPLTDAAGTGLTGWYEQTGGVDPGYNMNELMGLQYPTVPTTDSYFPGHEFGVGDALLNYPLNQSGQLSFMINDGALSDNTGQQMVKIIVTQ